MNLLLWIFQGVCAAGFFAAGMFKLVQPREKLAEKMKWAKDYTDSQAKLIGLAEVLGGIGLVVPWATRILPVLTPVAAVCLVIIMGGAAREHMRLKESPVPPLVLGAMCIVIALGRFGVFGY